MSGSFGKGFPSDLVKRTTAMLTALDAAIVLEDLRFPPGNHLEALKGDRAGQYGHLEERGFGASIEANFIVGSQVRLHRVTNACPQAYFSMILARISGGFRILNRIRLWAVVAHGKRGGGSCSLGWPW